LIRSKYKLFAAALVLALLSACSGAREIMLYNESAPGIDLEKMREIGVMEVNDPESAGLESYDAASGFIKVIQQRMNGLLLIEIDSRDLSGRGRDIISDTSFLNGIKERDKLDGLIMIYISKSLSFNTLDTMRRDDASGQYPQYGDPEYRGEEGTVLPRVRKVYEVEGEFVFIDLHTKKTVIKEKFLISDGAASSSENAFQLFARQGSIIENLSVKTASIFLSGAMPAKAFYPRYYLLK